jgi:serine/threonine protein kinase/Tol biopolymer transport system component
MTLAAGARLGPYEILSPLGAGGMGEVYKAKDTRLERTVAVKVLPSHMSASAEVRQRFEREARTISQLSHPHICALYDVGREGETEYLVMELLEGETLLARLAKGPLPPEQTLRYGVEIADALDKAHRQGIVHRDLKPGNVMLTKSGVKLLDFGLAKAMAPSAPAGSLTALPTQQGLTQEGTILGTFQYMAPEQLEGKEADGRTDIFAFGAVLYEMATGKKAFAGASQASLIAAILEREPPAISSVQPMSPAALDRVVKTCLAKDPEDRWQSAADIKRELRWIGEGSQSGIAAVAAPKPSSRRRLPWGLAAVFALVSLVSVPLALLHLRRDRAESGVLRLSVLPPEGAVLTGGFAVSPDGRQLAIAATDAAGATALWLRSFESGASVRLAGTEDARLPFWSPDGRRLGFFTRDKLKKTDLAGGIQILCDLGASTARGGSWSKEGVIIFSAGTTRAIQRVPADGGAPVDATRLPDTPNAVSHRWPQFLPDSRHFLYLVIAGKQGDSALLLGSLDGGKPVRVMTLATNNEILYSPSGHLLFVRNGSLNAQAFDPSTARLSGEPVSLAASVGGDRNLGWASFSASQNALVLSSSGWDNLELTWFDRAGKEIGHPGSHKLYRDASLSPDGKRAAAALLEADGTLDLWLLDILRDVASRFTFRREAAMLNPIWSPDGTRIVFGSSNDYGRMQIFVKSADGSGSDEPLLTSANGQVPTDWSADGRFVAFEERDPKTGKRDLWLLPMSGSGDRKPVPYLQTPFDKFQAQFSPDGRWMAYGSDESGRWEIYLQPVPASGGKWLVSNSGGTQPRWRRDGKELFYLSADLKIMSVDVTLGPTPELSAPKALFPARVIQNAIGTDEYVVTADGQRFLATAASGTTTAQPLTVVINWQEDLKKK